MTVEFRTISCHDASCHCCADTGRILELAGLTEAFIDVDLDTKFDAFNAKLFGGSLPKVPCSFRKLKGTLGGKCEYTVRWPKENPPNKRMKSLSASLYYKYAKLDEESLTITINTTFHRSEEGLNGILIHEMIHAYFAVTGNFGEDHGTAFKKMAACIGETVGYKIPLSDESEGLELTAEKPKDIAVFLITQQGRKPVAAIASPKSAEACLPAIQDRWGSYGATGHDIRVVIVSTMGWTRWSEHHAVQRTIGTHKDKRYYVEDPQLLADLDHGKVLLHIKDTKAASS